MNKPHGPQYTIHSRLVGRLIAGGVFAAGLLVGCAKEAPGVTEITPHVMADISQCDLWMVSDVKKVDGIPGKESYRVDFSAKLVLKVSAEETMQKIDWQPKNANAVQCLMVASMLIRSTGALWKSYDVSGAGEFIKSEKGWRLIGELGQYDFTPTQGQLDSDRALPRPVEYAPRTVTAPALTAPAVEAAPVDRELTPCVAAKMKAFEEKRVTELEESAKAARDAGDELKTSAGMESVMHDEALAEAKAACQNSTTSSES